MPNGPGDNRGQDPWGRRPEKGPPDLLDLIKKLFEKGKKPSTSSGTTRSKEPLYNPKHLSTFITGGIAILLIIWALSGIFILKPAEEAVILRFGKYIETVGPGPHWIPRFINSYYVINVQQVNNFPYQAEMLTKDENIVSVALAVQYRIANPKEFLFDVVNPVNTLQQATSSALRQEVGQMNLDAILTTGRQELRNQVNEQLKLTMAEYKTGLEITDVTLQATKPPSAVMHAFNDAVKAREDSQRYQNEAQTYARKEILSAKGEAAQILQGADAYRQATVLEAQGATARYLALLKPFQDAPRVTRERLYLDTVASVLSHTTNIIVDGGGNNVLLLPLKQLLREQASDKQSSSTADLPAPGVSSSSTPTTEDYGSSRPNYPGGGN